MTRRRDYSLLAMPQRSNRRINRIRFLVENPGWRAAKSATGEANWVTYMESWKRSSDFDYSAWVHDEWDRPDTGPDLAWMYERAEASHAGIADAAGVVAEWKEVAE